MGLLPIHILTASVGIAAGYFALFARKGGPLHRKSGRVFAYAMLVMSGLGAALASVPHHRLSGAAVDAKWSSVLGGLITFYLVVTGVLTVRRNATQSVWMDQVALGFGLAVGLLGLGFGIAATRTGGKLAGQPAAIGFVFGTVALLAAIGDLRLLRAQGIYGTPRIVRHLWRMSVAMLIATFSFFLGQARFIPKPFRVTPLLLLPELVVLGVMIYSLIRVRTTGRYARLAARPEAGSPVPLD